MDPAALLEQLRDIHAPIPPGWWPPAIGWWLLAILLILTLYGALVCFRWYQRAAWKRAAQKEFLQLKNDYLQSANSHTLTRISGLLKRCAAKALDQPAMLSATGEQWAQHLSSGESVLQAEEIELLSHGHYQANFAVIDDAALSRIELWIRRLSS